MRVKKASITSQWIALIRITRPWNLLMIGVSIELFAQVFAGTTLLSAVWPIASMMAMAAAGNVINDYFDQKEDKINKPRRALVGRVISRKVVLAEHFVLSLTAMAFAGLGAQQLEQVWPLVYIGLLGTVLTAYSPFFKRAFLRGNVIIALAVGQVPLWTGAVVQISEPNVWTFLWFYAGLSAWLTLLREITKDIQDRAGDAEWGYDTLPVRWGDDRAKRLLNGLFIPSGMLLLASAFWWWGQIGIHAAWSLAFLLPFFAAWRELRRSRIERVSAWLKMVLAGGLLALAVAPPLG